MYRMGEIPVQLQLLQIALRLYALAFREREAERACKKPISESTTEKLARTEEVMYVG